MDHVPERDSARLIFLKDFGVCVCSRRPQVEGDGIRAPSDSLLRAHAAKNLFPGICLRQHEVTRCGLLMNLMMLLHSFPSARAGERQVRKSCMQL